MPAEFGFKPLAEVWSTNRHGSWQRNMRLHRAWAEGTAWEWKGLPSSVRKTWKGVPATVHVTLTFREKRRRDPHNFVGTVVKAIVDGLVRAGVWPDDNPQWVTVIEPEIRIGSPWVQIRLEER